jgi:6-phosphofructokinase 1
MKKIGVFTSGGDAPGMNACIRAVVRSALKRGLEVAGIYRGYQGLIEGDIKNMDSHSVSSIINTGGTILRSARSKDFMTIEGRKLAYQNLKSAGIDGIVAIGGDGTFTGADIFMKEFPDINIVGCPGTIDNDLAGTDHTIGFDTAINTAMEAIDKIKDTANAHDRLFFVEVMGRDAGYIAMAAGIATGAEAVLVPEHKTNLDDLVKVLQNAHDRKKNSSIVVVAEGDEAGGAYQIADYVKSKLDIFEIKVSILGHIQRGGSPTCLERVRASRMGVAATDALLEGRSGVMIGIINNEIAYTPFENAIKKAGDISPKYLDLIRDLN